MKMEKSEHEVKYDELLASMPNEELAQELLRLTIEHDVSLEGINNLAAFFGRVAMENRGQTQVPGQLSLSLGGRRGAAGVDDDSGLVDEVIDRERQGSGNFIVDL